jgi:hypothetical protein
MKKTFQLPKFVPLDMSLCFHKGEKRGHPGINAKDTYLVLHDGQYLVGQFSEVWFGWSFDGWYAPLQFDPPGYNSSTWQAIWRMEGKKPSKVKHPEDKCLVAGCKGRLKTLKTRYGDPEGIRADRKCRKCGQYYACHKSGLRKMSKENYEIAEDDDIRDLTA